MLEKFSLYLFDLMKNNRMEPNPISYGCLWENCSPYVVPFYKLHVWLSLLEVGDWLVANERELMCRWIAIGLMLHSFHPRGGVMRTLFQDL